MGNIAGLGCDGCGQWASPEHIGRRLQRLEWATRYRPIHIGVLFLGAVAPRNESDFLYAPSGEFGGKAAFLLQAVGIETSGKSREAVLAEFQRGGFFLAYVLECHLDNPNFDGSEIGPLLEHRLSSVSARIRRSLKPKKLVLVSTLLEKTLERFKTEDLGCAMVLDSGKVFALDDEQPGVATKRLRDSLTQAFARRS